MNKRGQVTTFMIVGLVLLIVFALIFMLRDSLLEGIKGSEGTKLILNGVVEEIDFKIKDCVDSEANPALIMLGKQGGTFNPIVFKPFMGDKINYLCFRLENSNKCENLGLTRMELENELNNYLSNRIKNCISIESFRNDQRYTMTVGDFSFKTTILDESVSFNITYPITLERKGIKSSVSGFSEKISNPLGKLQMVVSDILNTESQLGTFDNVLYFLLKKSEYTIIQKRSTPDTIYVIFQKDSPYEFQFAIRGK